MPASPEEHQACLHPKLQLEQIVPGEAFVRGDIGGWYRCEHCGEQFSTAITPYQIRVVFGLDTP